jgi:hypothetical protein
VDTLEILWPSGQIEKLSNISASQTITITESKGITNNRSYNNHSAIAEGSNAQKTSHD